MTPESAPSVLKACPLCDIEVKRVSNEPLMYRHLSYIDIEKLHVTSCPLAGLELTGSGIEFWNRRSGPDAQMLEALKETHQAARALMVTIASHPELIAEMAENCTRAGVKKGFGTRAAAVIDAAEAL